MRDTLGNPHLPVLGFTSRCPLAEQKLEENRRGETTSSPEGRTLRLASSSANPPRRSRATGGGEQGDTPRMQMGGDGTQLEELFVLQDKAKAIEAEISAIQVLPPSSLTV